MNANGILQATTDDGLYEVNIYRANELKKTMKIFKGILPVYLLHSILEHYAQTDFVIEVKPINMNDLLDEE